ncbi:MAG: threonylcarbamoyl-AMP synthase [Alphaproteobacteria bacterium]|nr:threonylcarbamoyl-AMP synthase [Alphaproteobacteria bacterium]
MTAILEATPENIQKAADRLKSGGLVALPTETVYGLGADATNDRAVASIFAAKGRPSFNPVIVHFKNKNDAAQAVEFNGQAELLASLFWPGPLTLILPRRKDANISLLCSAGLPTLAVRCPAHPVAQQLIAALGRPIAAPSANKSGSLSPTTPQHVLQSLGENAGLILAGGKAAVGLESTVLDMTGEIPVLLRPGAVTVEDLQQHIGKVAVELEAVADNPKSPGQLLKHYAPKTPLRLRAVDIKPGEALLAFGPARFMGVQGGGAAKDLPRSAHLNLSEQGDLNEAAANLFAMLHQLDSGGFKAIAVMDIPEMGLGMAINDRLRRAAVAQNQ